MAELFADVMLEKLARWLRLAGIPIVSATHTDDLELLEFVKSRKGVLLTSDEALILRARKQKVKSVLIRQGTVERQLANAAAALQLKIDSEPGRICPVCNSRLVKADKKSIADLIPKHAYSHYRLFYLCRKCMKAYWHGTHWSEIKARLTRTKRMAKRLKQN